ncbi:MAG: methyltransferase domain-containing protein [Acidobacteria bacterium]|nr:methyltransferase domain-containing protein [Acidobacteriota bacterium]
MTDQNTAFVGSIPENYDRFLAPLFEAYSEDFSQRLKLPEQAALLELACGTGLMTWRLREVLPASVKIIATDLNEAMLDYARRKFPAAENLEWQQADATALPFSEQAFDAVACQFGWMFFPDKLAAMRQAHRVLKDDGIFLFNVWDKLANNPLPQLAMETVNEIFQNDPPKFYEIPFGFYDAEEITAMLKAVGFRDLQVEVLSKSCVSPTASAMAKGLVEGNPIIGAIQERGTPSVAEVEAMLAARIAAKFGDRPMQTTMQALVFECRR